MHALIVDEESPFPVGYFIGSYVIEGWLSKGIWGPIYLANQPAMSRQVRLYTLSMDRRKDPEEVQRFFAVASAKANASHPSFLAVFEAGQHLELLFYTCEHVASITLSELLEQKTFLTDLVALKILKVVAEGMAWLERKRIAHEPLNSQAILLDEAMNPRLLNLATVEGEKRNDPVQEICRLGDWVWAALPPEKSEPSPSPLRQLILSFQNDFPGFRWNWASLNDAVHEILSQKIGIDSRSMSTTPTAPITHLGAPSCSVRQAKLFSAKYWKFPLLYSFIALLFLGMGFFCWFRFLF